MDLLAVLRPGPKTYHMMARMITVIPASISRWVHEISESPRANVKNDSDGRRDAAGNTKAIMNGRTWQTLPATVVSAIVSAPTQAKVPKTGFQICAAWELPLAQPSTSGVAIRCRTKAVANARTNVDTA